MPDRQSDDLLTGDELKRGSGLSGLSGLNGLSLGKPLRAFVFMAGFLALLWAIQLANWADSYRLDQSFGIVPHSESHLADIFTAPFLHFSWQHLEGNSIPLLVPNVKNAHARTLADLARALADLAAIARDGRCTPADLTGGTITVTNVGVFGVDAGTPILTPGEAAILAFGRIRDAPWVHDGQLAVRKVTTLSLSFDHRIVDGELGSAVLRDVGQMLEDPVRVLAWA